MKKFIIKFLGGITQEELKSDYVAASKHEMLKENYFNAKEKNTRQSNSIKESLKLRAVFEKQIEEKTEKENLFKKELERLKFEWAKDLDKLNKISKERKKFRTDYYTLRSRIERTLNKLSDCETKSTANRKYSHWVDYEVYNVVGDDLIKIRKTLTGGKKK